jgi:hypothetical protein
VIETIQVRPYIKKGPTGEKEFGEPREIKGCKIWPRTGDEIDAGGAIIDGLNIYVPPRSDPAATPQVPVAIKATDRILARGKEWDVDGVPGEFRPNSGVKVILMTKKVGA